MYDEKVNLDKQAEFDEGNKQAKMKTCWKKFEPYCLLILLCCGMCIGIGLGAGMRTLDPPLTPAQINYFKFPGDLLMRMLKMLILPLIVTSLIAGMAALDSRASGKMGGIAVAYYLTTTFAAVILGIILVSAIQPGRGQEKKNIDEGSKKVSIVEPADAMLDLIRNAFPKNLVTSCFRQTRTIQEPTGTGSDKSKDMPKVSLPPNATEEEIGNVFTTIVQWLQANAEMGIGMDNMNNSSNMSKPMVPPIPTKPKVTETDGLNVLGLVVFSVVFGIIIGRMGPHGEPLALFFDAFHHAIMKMVKLVIWYAPIGIIFLLATKIIETADPLLLVKQLGMYAATVLAGLAIHFLIILPLIYFIFVRKNPFKLMLGVGQALVHALATASSSATLPLTMRCLEEDCGIDGRVTRFVAPVGATINMDGTALYEAVAAIFIAQLNGMWPMDIGKIITISITATAAAIGAAGVPEGGLVTMTIVLTAVGLPPEDTALILSIDWFLDRFRTMTNVWGDSVGAGIVNHYSKNFLEKLDDGDKQAMNGTVNTGFEPTTEESNTKL